MGTFYPLLLGRNLAGSPSHLVEPTTAGTSFFEIVSTVQLTPSSLCLLAMSVERRQDEKVQIRGTGLWANPFLIPLLLSDT